MTVQSTSKKFGENLLDHITHQPLQDPVVLEPCGHWLNRQSALQYFGEVTKDSRATETSLVKFPKGCPICGTETSAFHPDGRIATIAEKVFSQLEGDLAWATHLCKLAAEEGTTQTLFRLAMRYDAGDGVIQYYPEAARLFKLLADKGYAPAQNALGWYYERGLVAPQNLQEAVRLYRLAAAQGNAVAKARLEQISRYHPEIYR